jgi:hypothetical protein
MAKQDYGECTGKCPICTINLWGSTGGKPVIFPCNIEKCPYEDPTKQNRKITDLNFSLTGSGLAQIE